MTKKEIIAKIEELDKKQFMLMMKDNWDNEDYRMDSYYTMEICKLKAMLEE